MKIKCSVCNKEYDLEKCKREGRADDLDYRCPKGHLNRFVVVANDEGKLERRISIPEGMKIKRDCKYLRYKVHQSDKAMGQISDSSGTETSLICRHRHRRAVLRLNCENCLYYKKKK